MKDRERRSSKADTNLNADIAQLDALAAEQLNTKATQPGAEPDLVLDPDGPQQQCCRKVWSVGRTARAPLSQLHLAFPSRAPRTRSCTRREGARRSQSTEPLQSGQRWLCRDHLQIAHCTGVQSVTVSHIHCALFTVVQCVSLRCSHSLHALHCGSLRIVSFAALSLIDSLCFHCAARFHCALSCFHCAFSPSPYSLLHCATAGCI